MTEADEALLDAVVSAIGGDGGPTAVVLRNRIRDALRDIDKPGYPLPCDPVSGMGWWRFNLAACSRMPAYAAWQEEKRMDEIIPVIRWIVYGGVNGLSLPPSGQLT